ncbi:MAG: redox-sensing transcriptional repressor Rex [Spirochaetales bacterium]
MKTSKLTSIPSIRRLPSYLILIQQAVDEGLDYISGTVIAQELELEPIQVRKDLALTGIMGKPRIGYSVKDLYMAINRFLHWDTEKKAGLIGTGNLGQALMGNQEFLKHGLKICAGFDVDPLKIGKNIHGIDVFSLNQLQEKTKEMGLTIAILTVPPSEAQVVAEQIVLAGISAIWNFTNVKLKVPKSIIVQQEDLSSGYAVLSVKMGVFQRRTN